jgi:hypothetical protein
VTYSLDHVTGDRWLTELLDTLETDVSELRRMLIVYADVMDLPGRGPEADPDRTGRQATHDPARPTERVALDSSRAGLAAAIHSGAQRVTYAIALVRGTTAELDRALLVWEGYAIPGTGGVHGSADGVAGDPRAA